MMTAVVVGVAGTVTVAAFLTGHDGAIIPAFFGFIGGLGFHFGLSRLTS